MAGGARGGTSVQPTSRGQGHREVVLHISLAVQGHSEETFTKDHLSMTLNPNPLIKYMI